MLPFQDATPTLVGDWRHIVRFGRNVASGYDGSNWPRHDGAISSGRRNTLQEEVAMSARKRRSDRSGRAALFSPGRPPVAGRDERRRFWAAIAAGKASEAAAVEAGVPQAVGTRWFRKAGGMPSVDSVGNSYDNAFAETINGLFKAEVIHRRGPWRSVETVEFATLE